MLNYMIINMHITNRIAIMMSIPTIILYIPAIIMDILPNNILG